MLGGMRWWPGPGVDVERLRRLVERAAIALSSGAVDRKDSRRKASFVAALEGGEPDVLVKCSDYTDLAPWRRLGRSKARAEVDRAEALARKGIDTPLPLAAGERRAGLLLERCQALVPWLPDAIDLQRARREGFPSPAARRTVAREWGELVRRMHEAGIDQDDLAPNNFLWRRGSRPHLLAIDFERVRLRARIAAASRVRALAKLERHCSGESSASRMRFLRAYARGDRSQARLLWRAIETASASLFLRDVRRWTRTATHRGRRFEPIDLRATSGRWCGWWRRGGDPQALRAALDGGVRDVLWTRELGSLSARGAARAWGLAQALHQRAASPEPVALLRRERRAVLVWAAPFDGVPLSRERVPALRSALVVWMDRLQTWGELRTGTPVDAIAISRSATQCWLLDPLALHLSPLSTSSGGRARARARVAELFG